MEDIAKNHFEVVYKEYKEYENFAKNLAPKILKEREEFAKYMADNKDNADDIVNKLVELNFKPSLYQADLQRLQMRLVYVFEAYDSIIEIPSEVKEEIKVLKPKQLFKIENNEAVEIEPEVIKNIEDNFKSQEFNNIVKVLEGLN